MKIKSPNNYSTIELYQQGVKSIVFLAGSIENGKVTDWQERAANLFEENNIATLNPQRNDWNSDLKQNINKKEFNEQVNWELESIRKCDFVFMNFEENTYSPTTLLELGLCAISKSLVVVCHPNFWRRDDVEITCKYYNIPLFNDFEEGIVYMLSLINKNK